MSSAEPAEGNSTMASWLRGRVWVLLSLCLALIAIVTRVLSLAEKPFHHDESLHAYYSHRVSQGIPYEYSALLHGPVLYYLVGFFMSIFGATDFTARLPAALCSIALALIPLLWRKKIGTAAALFISGYLIFSPTFMYFGRFLREDAFNTLWICCSLAGFWGYRWTSKPWMAVCCSAFLAMQFCNKENSYLHIFIWISGIVFISFLARKNENIHDESFAKVSLQSKVFAEKIALWVNCVLVFSVIYILFFSSFFRHSKGSMHGVLDGLYRESLLYWWDQNQKRRIDGPFDYHSPLFFNYEFALIPALVAGWLRATRCASLSLLSSNSCLRFPFVLLRPWRRVWVAGALIVGVIALPRIGLTQDGCSIAEFCLKNFASNSVADSADRFAHLLHLTQTRHVFQLLSVALLGAVAVLASVTLGRSLDAFLWWWATGAIGTYSYVGEKVPWLHLYILLPLVVLAGLEVGRCFHSQPLWIDSLLAMRSPEAREKVLEAERQWSRGIGQGVIVLSSAVLLFAAFKAIRLSFPNAALPIERLVFTQSTPVVGKIRARWLQLAEQKNAKPRVTMAGDATWPFAWYVHDLPGADFRKPSDSKAAEPFDAVFLDFGDLDFARQQLLDFDVYQIPLRHWWVPQPNPRWQEIFEYFLTNRPYPKELRQSPSELGMGDTSVLYLEKRTPGSFFEASEPLEGIERVALAGRLNPLKELNSPFKGTQQP